MPALEEKPVKEVLVTMHSFSYLFALATLTAAIAWIYFMAKAFEEAELGVGVNHDKLVITVETLIECAVVSILLYFIFRHHFSQSHM